MPLIRLFRGNQSDFLRNHMLPTAHQDMPPTPKCCPHCLPLYRDHVTNPLLSVRRKPRLSNCTSCAPSDRRPSTKLNAVPVRVLVFTCSYCSCLFIRSCVHFKTSQILALLRSFPVTDYANQDNEDHHPTPHRRPLQIHLQEAPAKQPTLLHPRHAGTGFRKQSDQLQLQTPEQRIRARSNTKLSSTRKRHIHE